MRSTVVVHYRIETIRETKNATRWGIYDERNLKFYVQYVLLIGTNTVVHSTMGINVDLLTSNDSIVAFVL